MSIYKPLKPMIRLQWGPGDYMLLTVSDVNKLKDIAIFVKNGV